MLSCQIVHTNSNGENGSTPTPTTTQAPPSRSTLSLFSGTFQNDLPRENISHHKYLTTLDSSSSLAYATDHLITPENISSSFALFLPAPMATGGEPRAAAAAEGGEKRAALLREITEEGGFAFVASAEKAAADGDLRAAEAAREMAWEQLHACPRSEVGRAWRDAYALACLHVAALRVAGGGGDGRRAALRALDMGLIMGGDLLRAELEEAIARVVADRSRGCGGGGGDGAGENGADVEKWMEGLTRKRDLADVSISSNLSHLGFVLCLL